MYVYSAFIILIVILIVYLILYAKLTIIISYTCSKSEHVVQVTVYLYHLRLLKRLIPLVEWDEVDLWNVLTNMDRSSNKDKHMLAKIKEAAKDVGKFLSVVHIHQFEWNTRIGTGEASTTGLITGGVWTSKGVLFGRLSEKTVVKCQPKINVIPHFQERMLQTKIDCIVTIKTGQAIHTYIQSK
ncbi:MAG TPA: DUF2953 domain-containing protein [Virgibacillus sp.]|nr:DUF2953 domain-containing protein [Virgibacillus sp.]